MTETYAKLKKKFQITKSKYQTNPNDPNSKFETKVPSILTPGRIICGIAVFAKPHVKLLMVESPV